MMANLKILGPLNKYNSGVATEAYLSFPTLAPFPCGGGGESGKLGCGVVVVELSGSVSVNRVPLLHHSPPSQPFSTLGVFVKSGVVLL